MSVLDKLTNIAVVVASVAIVSQVTQQQYAAHIATTRGVYKAGDRIQNTTELALEKAPLTVMLGTASTCHFCTASMDFYGQLTTQAKVDGVRVIGVTGESPTENHKYLESHNITVERIVSQGRNHIDITATPTLLVVKSDGTVVSAYRGKLTDDQEQELLQTVHNRRFS